jgi:hypothetical protein
MILSALIIEILVGSKDTCALKFNAWADSNHNKFTKNEMSYFFWYATTGGCSYDFDSLPNRAKIRKINDSVIAKNNDTIVDWELWVRNNSMNYTHEEIEELRTRCSHDMRSKWFYQYVDEFNLSKKQRIEKLKRQSFAHLAVSMASSDSMEFLRVKKDCQWQTPEDPISQYYVNCTQFSSKHGVYYDGIKTIHSHGIMRKISNQFLEEIIKNDSEQIYEKRHYMGRAGLGCGESLVAVLIVYYDEVIYRIDFDDINGRMAFKTDSKYIGEFYSPKFYNRLKKYFGKFQEKTSGCSG